jgi:hypothetical protein
MEITRRALFCLMKITCYPDGNHVIIGLFTDGNHDRETHKLMPGTLTDHREGQTSQIEMLE